MAKISHNVTGMNRLEQGPLTKRQREVAEYILQGLGNKAIAEILGITEDTLKRHIYHIYLKLNVKTRLELAVKVLTKRHKREIKKLQAELYELQKGQNAE